MASPFKRAVKGNMDAKNIYIACQAMMRRAVSRALIDDPFVEPVLGRHLVELW